ncbi:MAG: peptide chain release factor N(5)-glutamine methyltransferase [Elusimicrobiaceae bacterium]|nr:peptide chain release factor N(5)-glutamine methyltransferase [Elusimicrobiaceae bacterium]
MDTSYTIEELISAAAEQLAEAGSDEPQANAEWLLACVLNVTRTWLLMNRSQHIGENDFSQYQTFLARKAAGEPLSHIVGFQPFCGLNIRVTPSVLTPRPETEELVDLVSAHYERRGNYRFLDMCTGSGCIALALADRFSKAQILGVDISESALKVAQENATRLRLLQQVQFLQSDIWENVQGTFDLIISNPPYIPSEIVDTLTREVLHEPRLALDGGADGLDIVRPLCALAGDYLNPGGLFALELCKGQAAAVARGLEEIGWKAEVKKDIVGIERFVLARKI